MKPNSVVVGVPGKVIREHIDINEFLYHKSKQDNVI